MVRCRMSLNPGHIHRPGIHRISHFTIHGTTILNYHRGLPGNHTTGHHTINVQLMSRVLNRELMTVIGFTIEPSA